MKNLKKLLAALVVVTLLATSMMPAFAAGSYTYTTQAQALYDLGLYKGSSTTTFEPDLGSALDRQQGVVMLIRLLGKESAALALSDAEVNATLIIFSDAKDLASWAKKQIAYAVLYKYVAGLPNGTFAPNNALSGKEYCTMLLRALGYTVDAAGYAGACYQLSNIGGITFSEAAKFNDKELIRDDMVGISYGVLKADYKATGKSIIETMVETKVVTEAKAITAGVYNTKLEEDAKAAIAAYKAAPISNLTEIAAAEAKKAAADAAVAKIVVAATKTALQKEIDDQAAKIAAAKKAINDSDDAEKAAIAAAETAVKAYESASIATTADVTAAEALGKTAEGKVALVKTEASKTAFTGRITAQGKKVSDRKTDLANIASATAAVDAYLVAPYNSTSTITEAEKLALAAEDKVAKIVDSGKKAELTKKINDQKAIVAAEKIKLNSAAVVVSAENFKTMKLVFSKAMDKNTLSSAIKLNDGAYAYTLNVADDNKTVVLSYDTAITNQSTNIKLTIEGAKDLNGITFDKFEKTYVVKDLVEPQINTIEVVSAKTIRIYTSEPISVSSQSYPVVFDGYASGPVNGATITIDNVYAYATVTQNLIKGYVQLDFTTPFVAGSRTMVINGLKDFAGFVASGTYTFQVAADSASPVATAVEIAGKDKVKVTFNENIADGSNAAYNSSAVFSVLQAGSTTKVRSISTVYKDNTVTVEFPANTLNLLSTLGYEIYYQYVSDARGNYVAAETKIAGVATNDSTKPVVSSVYVESDNAIKVVFSKKVVANASNFRLLFTNNTIFTYATNVANYDPDNIDGMTYKVTFSSLTGGLPGSGIDAQNFVLEIGDVADTSINQNIMDVSRHTVTIFDTKYPEIAVIAKTNKIQDATSIKPYTLEIYFSEVMDASLITSKSNYFISYMKGTDSVTVPLSSITNATLATTDNKKVVITLPDDGKMETLYPITGVSVIAKDLKGNPLVGVGAIGSPFAAGNFTDTSTGVVTGNYAFDTSDIDTIKFIASNKIQIKIKNPADGSAPLNIFSNSSVIPRSAFSFVNQSGNAINIGVIGAVVSADGKTLDITIDNAVSVAPNSQYWNATTNAYEYYKIVTTAGVKDQYGLNLSLNRNITDGIAPLQLSDINKVITIATTSTQPDQFDRVTKLALNSITAGSYVELKFNEVMKSKGAVTDMAQGLEVKIGTKILVPGIDYYTVFNSSDTQTSISASNGTSIYIKFLGSAAKNTLKDDLSNLTVRISNNAYIIDKDGGNKVTPW